ncbi:hypothetical protein QJS66_10365 [Kocuria rhizophila]|nr:hypothetical protein QJS66_10365 [Kocuria rhizophila]
MAHAKDEVTAALQSERTGQPFNLSMLTLDTHDPSTSTTRATWTPRTR